MIKSGKDKIDTATDAIRLPNAVPKGATMKLSTDPNAVTQ